MVVALQIALVKLAAGMDAVENAGHVRLGKFVIINRMVTPVALPVVPGKNVEIPTVVEARARRPVQADKFAHTMAVALQIAPGKLAVRTDAMEIAGRVRAVRYVIGTMALAARQSAPEKPAEMTVAAELAEHAHHPMFAFQASALTRLL